MQVMQGKTASAGMVSLVDETTLLLMMTLF